MAPPSESISDLSSALPALSVRAGECAIATADGEIETISRAMAGDMLTGKRVLVCNASFLARRLGIARPPRRAGLLDILDLFAFAYPARPLVPTPVGLARALSLPHPTSAEEEAVTLHLAAAHLLKALGNGQVPAPEHAAGMGRTLAKTDWSWGPSVSAALGDASAGPLGESSGYDVWMRLPEWEDRAPEPPSGTEPIGEAETAARLEALVGTSGEARAAQAEYAKVAAASLRPRDTPDDVGVVLAEAGTGLGKTLGYLAPASLWAEKNGPGIWIATYTKNLQRQLDQELARVYPDPDERRRWTTIRKGRENYLCLLNYQELATRAISGLGGGLQIDLALIARWAMASRDGDMVGGDFPIWLETGLESQLTDRRGECIFSACPHYRRCVIEKSVRKAPHARLVVANHALVLTQAALDQTLTPASENAQEDGPVGRRYLIFDEGHHLFQAADSAFSAHLTALEASELRRWLRGPEGRRGSRARGLIDRIGDLTGDSEEAENALQQAVKAARALPTEGWSVRLADGAPLGPAEEFLSLVRGQIAARTEAGYIARWETPIAPLAEGIAEAAEKLDVALGQLARPMEVLATSLRERLDQEAKELETTVRTRIESAARGLDRRAKLTLPGWRMMLQSLGADPDERFSDWFAMENFRGRLFDLGMHRHWVDPTEPLAQFVLDRAQGTLITSATLRDTTTTETQADGTDTEWQSAEVRTGVAHLSGAAARSHFTSPFDYAKKTKVLIVNDLSRENPDQVGAAFRELFKAAGGGGLGLFTAIHRLRAIFERIAEPLERDGIDLYAQHVDALDPGTLVDIFRSEESACLLGTDAVRDGIDVPGASLRLIVFDRVPWPRPDILHKARRERFGKRTYDDMLTRLKLKQAFGRLIRQKDDHGVFVMLDGRTPSRLLTAFPEGVEVQRMGLAEAIAATRDFLHQS